MGMTLKDIEMEISGCVKVDRKNWTRIYKLMEAVESEKLYLQREDTPSFTKWVNILAEELGVHVSLLWARKKAGKSYDEYARRAEQQGRRVRDLEDLSVSPDSINLCEKVAGKNAAEMDRLIDRVVAGELTRDDLRAAAKAKRSVASEAGVQAMATSRHDRIEADERTETEEKVTAADIVMALRRSDWLAITNDGRYFQHKYQHFPEFGIDTGTSTHARRMDALIAETVTAKERGEVILRGVEIKVDRHDLENDHKMAEYTDFCDYFYLAVPEGEEEMITLAESLIRPAWGILTVSKEGTIRIAKEPVKLDALMRDKTLAACLIKLMSE